MKLYDTLSGEKREFKPLDGRTVKMYVCGVTPYDTTHIGHAMTYLTFDVLNRYCQFLGWRVRYVQNVTDIDDDILKRAKRDNEQWDLLGDRHPVDHPVHELFVADGDERGLRNHDRIVALINKQGHAREHAGAQVALAVGKVAVDSARGREFVLEFLARWGEARARPPRKTRRRN